LQSELFRVMSQRISELETIAGDLSADERIAMFLLSLSDRFSRRGYSDREFILAMSRRDIASYLRLATETVSRVLARFQKAGVVKVDRKQVRRFESLVESSAKSRGRKRPENTQRCPASAVSARRRPGRGHDRVPCFLRP
jgi:CRP/FNR family transcriptional regulator, anaerobic regulatory protein